MWILIADTWAGAAPDVSPDAPAPRGWRRAEAMPPGETRYELDRTIDDSFSYLALYPSAGVPVGGARSVHDIRIQAEIGPVKNSGDSPPAVVLEWSHAGRTVRAEVLSTGEFLLRHGAAQSPGRLARGSLAGALALEVRDGTAALLEGPRVAASIEVGPDDLESARKVPAGVPCSLAIELIRCPGALERLAVFRDIHYRDDMGDAPGPIVLGPEERLILGDDPSMSLDGRFRAQRPVVTIRGVVRWIYAPLGRWRAFD